MEINDVIFIDSLPTLDLHGYDRATANVKTLEFIKDNIVLKNDIICIIHGIGSGALKQEIHSSLRKNNNVLDFKLFYNNNGCTIVKLKI